jgi:hypothetical protein
MLTLLEKLASAAEGSRLLDAKVARAIGLRVDLIEGMPTVFEPRGGRLPCPAFTSSLDAAVGALPAGWCWSFNSEDGEATVWRRWPSGQVEEFSGFSAHAPIAISMAAIESRGRAARVLRPARIAHGDAAGHPLR